MSDPFRYGAILALFSFCAGSACGVEPNAVAIVYDGPSDNQAKGYIHALFIENLLGHFGLSGELIPARDYEPGELAKYRAGFFVGVTAGVQLPTALVQDVSAYQGPFCWLGQHLDQLTNNPAGQREYGFIHSGYGANLGIRSIVYKNTVLPKIEPDLNLVSVVDGKGVEVVATAATKQGQSHPYVLRRNRFWYFADSPFAYPEEGDHYLAFCDLLHDILGIQHASSKRALVRIEDVSIDLDPDDLHRVADLLAGYHIPFQIALIPIFRDPAKELEVRLSERRSVAEAVRYMVSRGGTPVLHGITHQYRAASGDDYEFWDDTSDHAIAGDSADLVMRRMQLGLAECFAAGIFPVAFETPHYAASEIDYRTMQRVFTLFYDRVISTPSLGSMQYFPYPVVDRWGRQLIPEDLGYLPQEKPDPKDVIAHARNLQVVRDGVASFYFHPFLDTRLLDETVRGIEALGYHFISLHEFSNSVDYQGRYTIRTASGKVRLNPQNEYTRVRIYDAAGALTATEVSIGRRSGPVDLGLEIPQGGWAAADCLKELPVQRRAPGVFARLHEWWKSATASDRNAFAHSFVSGRKVWLLAPDKPSAAAARNAQSYRTVLETFGYNARLVRASEFRGAPGEQETILIVPQAAGGALSPAQQGEILGYLTSGGPVVAEGRQAWLEKLGFKWEKEARPLSVGAVVDELYPEMGLRWRPEEKLDKFLPPDGVRELMIDGESDQVLAFSGEYGSGRYIYLAAPLDPHSGEGTSHYPYFAKYLTETFGANTSLRSPRLEAYFDPSYRPGADLNRLAAQWRKSGIRTVYTAAWIFYPKYQFTYDEFVRACHRNGVAVYAWFIFPATTPKMWEDHPEWREKTAAGGDGRIGWRYLMNMQNPAAFGAAMDWAKSILRKYEWDGVNLTELNFDADPVDYIKAERLVPFNADVRADFRKRAGFDPVALFAPASAHYYKSNPGALQKYMRYRESLVTDLHRRVLSELEPLRRERRWEMIVTALDSLHSRYVRPALGLDSKSIIGLMKEFPFTLQVEDPSEYWMKSPDRYRRFAQTYRKLVKDPRRVMFDVNVVEDRDVDRTNLPSPTATGMELARTVAAAASLSGRVAIYSEHTVPAQDWAFLRVALTRDAAVTAAAGEWRIDSPVPVILTPAEDRDYYLDGKLWPAVSPDGVLAPGGRHWLSTVRPWHHFLDPGALPARILSFTGDLVDARVIPTGLVFRYSSPGRAVMVLNQRPREILVDGRRTSVPLEQGGNWALAFPGGDHWVAVVTNTRAGVAINLWGWASASAITLFGAVATGLMLLIYFEVRLRRVVRRRAREPVSS